MSKGNYFILGIAISYLIVAFIQFINSQTLGAAVYITVSFVSFEFATIELIKSLINMIKENLNIGEKIINDEYERLKSTIASAEKFESLQNETLRCKSELENLEKISTKFKNKNKRYIEISQKLYSVLSALQIIICMVQIIITPLKLIPYDLLTNKTINVISLISFAMVFFSYFIINMNEEKYNSICLRRDIEENSSSYYLKLMSEMSKEKEEKRYESIK